MNTFDSVDYKLQNEIKVKSNDIVSGDSLHTIVGKFVKEVFSENLGSKVDFDCNKDWTISIGIKTNEEGIRKFIGTLKMVDVSVTGKQLSIFNQEEEVMRVIKERKAK